MQHAYHITLGPLVEITVITILAFGIVPLVERLHHHHETHFVTKTYELGSRCIVRSPHRIATHVLQHCQLMPQCRYAHGRSERTEVMVIADALEFPVLAVQVKALLRNKLDRTDAETRLIFIRHNPVHQDAGQCLIEVRVLRRPKLRLLHQELLHMAVALVVQCHRPPRSHLLAIRRKNVRSIFYVNVFLIRLQ